MWTRATRDVRYDTTTARDFSRHVDFDERFFSVLLTGTKQVKHVRVTLSKSADVTILSLQLVAFNHFGSLSANKYVLMF